MTATRTSLRRRFALIFSALMGALLVIVSGTLMLRQGEGPEGAPRDLRPRLREDDEQTSSATHWRLYYRSGAYKFRDIVRTRWG